MGGGSVQRGHLGKMMQFRMALNPNLYPRVDAALTLCSVLVRRSLRGLVRDLEALTEQETLQELRRLPQTIRLGFKLGFLSKRCRDEQFRCARITRI